jgi:hypothetical protein
MLLGPQLIYLLKNCCPFFTGLFDESYFLDDRQGPPIVEERRVRRPPSGVLSTFALISRDGRMAMLDLPALRR